jgi:hypothetical protein
VPYQVVEDFRFGMDRRKERATGVPGTLWTLENAVINRGGEIERTKKWVPQFSLPPDQTFGLATLSDTPYVFGSVASPGVPAGVSYQRLQHPDGVTAMTKILSVDRSKGKLYAIAQFADGSIHHYYDGALVRDWDAGRVTSYMVNNAGIAAHFVTLINATSRRYTATQVGAIIRITGANANDDFAVATSTENVPGGNDDQSLTTAVTQAASSTLPKIVEITVGGTFEVGDKFSIRLGAADTLEVFGYGGTPRTPGRIAKTFSAKVYVGGDELVDFSGVDHPEIWQIDSAVAPGAGFIDPGSQDSSTVPVTGLEIYENLLAIFGKESIQLWQVSNDNSSNAIQQILRNTGTTAPKAVKGFGSRDLFYYAQSGVRSLKAREATSVGYADDIGSAMDEFIQDYGATLTAEQRAAACADIEPRTERYFMALGDRVFVFSKFPRAGVEAWSYMNVGVQFTDMVRSFDRLFARSGDTIYVYGGMDGNTYPDDDESVVTVDMPFYAMQSPGSWKKLKAIDMAAVGQWDSYILPDPNKTDVLVPFATLLGTTYQNQRVPIEIDGPVFAFRFVCRIGGLAKLMQFMPVFDRAYDSRG